MNIQPDLDRSLYTLGREIKAALKGESQRGLVELERDRVLLILTDGLGYSLGEKVGLKAEMIHSVFPTITVTVLTTLLTATPPGVHGIMGWRVLNRAEGRIDNLLRNERVHWGQITEVRPYAEDSLVLCPNYSPALNLLSSFGRVLPYYSPWDGAVQALEATVKSKANFVFLYLPYVDSVSHHWGPESESTLRTARELVEMVTTLGRDVASNGKYSVVLTSDHGHVQVEGNVTIGREILDYADLPPFGDHRNLMIMSRRDPSEFLSRFGLRTLRREELAKITGGENVPDYAGVPEDRRLYSYWDDKEEMGYRGSHGGMSREEIEVPLVVWQ